MPNTEDLMKDQKRLMISTTPPSDGIKPPRPDYVNLQTDTNNNIINSNGNINNNNNDLNNNKNDKIVHDDSVFYVNLPQTEVKTVKSATLTPAPRTRGRLNSGKRPGQQFDQYDDDNNTSNYYELPAGSIGDRDTKSKYVNVEPRSMQPRSTCSPKKYKSSYINLFFPSPLVRSPSASSSSNSSFSHPSDSTLSPTPLSVQSPTSSLVHSFSTSSISSRSSSMSAASSDYVRINSKKTEALQRTISEHRPQREKKKKNKKGLF